MIEDKKYRFEDNVLYLKKPDGSMEELFKVIKPDKKDETWAEQFTGVITDQFKYSPAYGEE